MLPSTATRPRSGFGSESATKALPANGIKTVEDGGRARDPATAYIRLEEQLPKGVEFARFVKCFSSVGNTCMVDPDFGGRRPTMFICGYDAAAKGAAGEILDQFGWDVADMGGVEAARAIEPLCILWCIPGLLSNEWTHAFALLR